MARLKREGLIRGLVSQLTSKAGIRGDLTTREQMVLSKQEEQIKSNKINRAFPLLTQKARIRASKLPKSRGGLGFK